MCEKYKQIVVQVASCAGFRIFKTNSFTIRTLVVHLQRYCGKFEILSVSYGDYDGSSEWSQVKKELPNGLPIQTQEPKEYLLAKYNYRDAINIYYCQCAANGTYPSKAPFKGVTVEAEPNNFKYGKIQHPLFVWDAENQYSPKSDILRWYDGQRINKYLNGQLVSGYLLTKSRQSAKTNNQTTE